MLLSVVAAWREQREHRPWEQLEMSTTATRAQLQAAEAVVRYGRASSDPVVPDQALRIVQLARRQAGPPAIGLTIAAVAAAALVLVAVVSNTLWPLPAASGGRGPAGRCVGGQVDERAAPASSAAARAAGRHRP